MDQIWDQYFAVDLSHPALKCTATWPPDSITMAPRIVMTVARMPLAEDTLDATGVRPPAARIAARATRWAIVTIFKKLAHANLGTPVPMYTNVVDVLVNHTE